MVYYAISMTSGELYHHGILGQKWGQRNGPPYPLGSGDHSSREVKAGWRASLKRKTAEKVVDKSIARTSSSRKISNNSPKQDTTNSSSSSEFKGLTEKQKKILKIGAAIAVTGIAAYGAYKLYGINADKYKYFVNEKMFAGQTEAERLSNMLSSSDFKGSSDFNRHKAFQYMPNDKENAAYYLADISTERASLATKLMVGKDDLREAVMEVIEEHESSYKNNALKRIFDSKSIPKWNVDSDDLSFDSLRDIINPSVVNNLDSLNFDPANRKETQNAFAIAMKYAEADRTTNCMYCTTAFDLNKRGYKVKANGRLDGGFVTELFDMYDLKDDSLMFFKGKALNVKTITDKLASYNNGDYARGNMIVTFKGGGGHSVAWEMVNHELTVMDYQVGMEYKGSSLKSFLNSIADCNTVRTDNADLIWSDQLLRAIDFVD